jgi:hypothetical protein
MSNSSKQRAFINRALSALTQLGCKVTLELNKHYKVKIEKNSQIKTWAVSCTPHNRYVAQREAISDLRKILLEIGAIQNKHEIGEGLLHLMTDHQNIDLELLIDRDTPMNNDLFKELLKASYPNLTNEDISSILAIEEILNSVDFPKNLMSSNNSKSNWNIISNNKHQQLSCSRNVLAIGGDISKRLPNSLRLPNALSVSKAMHELFSYYQSCSKICKLGILLTDCWRPSEMLKYQFDQYIEANEQLGIKTVAILKSSGKLYPITWPWR